MTKKAKIEYFKNLLNNTLLDFKFTNGSTEFQNLESLFQKHPEKTMRNPTEYYFVGKSPNHPSNCFYRKDITGYITDFSFYKAINGKPKLEIQVHSAFREVVRESILNAKFKLFDEHKVKIGKHFFYLCPLTNALCKKDEIHADHAPPQTFQILVKLFLSAKKINLSDVKLKLPKNNSSLIELIDEELRKDFLTYHSENAHIRLISKSIHLKTSHQFRIKKTDKQLELQL